MNVTISPSAVGGSIEAVASKSVAHRLLICAALANTETHIRCEQVNDDINATVRCLCALGANVLREGCDFTVSPLSPASLPHSAEMDCGESGSTLRFLLPVIAALGVNAAVRMHGRLSERPLSPLDEALKAHGVTLTRPEQDTLLCCGRLTHGEYRIRGDVSSQFVSGLLFALSCLDEPSRLIIDGTLASAPYVDMTVDALAAFSAQPARTSNGFKVGGVPLVSPKHARVEGDWSGAAFPLCMGALSSKGVTVQGLSAQSRQGDRAILSVLRQFGANVTQAEDSVTVSSAPLSPIELDATHIPDLVPVIAVTACGALGTTVIHGAERLRLKESDRIESTVALIRSLGGHAEPLPDGLLIHGSGRLAGGSVSSYGDHRIAMSAAVASLLCDSAVTVTGAESVGKSYPAFWQAFASLGAVLRTE